MSILSRLRALLMPGRRVDEPDPESRRVMPAFRTTGGTHVDSDSALQNATVWACVTYLSRTVAQLPWRAHLDVPNGSRRASTHPVDYLLHKRPNPEMSSFAFRETMIGWAARRGNAVAEIQRDARGVPVGLWPIHPTRVEFKRSKETGELLFEVNNGADGVALLRGDQVFHIRGFGEGPIGLDVVSYAAESIGWARATELFGSSFFGNGANPAGFLYVPGKLTPNGFSELESRLASKHGGPAKANRTMILDGNLKYEPSSVAPDKAQFIETRQHQVEEICRWFGVPPHKVMHLLRSTFSNIEHQSIEVVVDSITPWVLRCEQEADFKLFGQNRAGYFSKMDLKGLLRGDFKSRQEGLQIQRRNGIINANQWCRLEDMDEIGPDGDKYIVEGNMTTLAAVGAAPPAPAAPAQPDRQDDNNDDDGTPVERARRQAQRAQLH